MHPNVTSKEKLLLAAKELAKTEGLSALQMRSQLLRQALPLVPFIIIFPTKTPC